MNYGHQATGPTPTELDHFRRLQERGVLIEATQSDSGIWCAGYWARWWNPISDHATEHAAEVAAAIARAQAKARAKATGAES